MGVLMNLINATYLEGQARRIRMIEICKYMQWRVLPRELKSHIRRYIDFVWDCNEHIGETENKLMAQLSPTLRMSLCVHIFGSVLLQAPFLTWMTDYPWAVKMLAERTASIFRDKEDILFSYGEQSGTIFILVNGWVTIDRDQFGTSGRISTTLRTLNNIESV